MVKELNAQPRIEDLPEYHVAYVRHIGPYKGDSQLFARLIERLMRWAGPRGLLGSGSPLMVFYHDHPDLTEEQNLRLSVAIEVPAETPVEGEIGKMAIPAGRYVAVRFELLPDEYQQAWDWVMGQWLPASGYQPDDGLCFERYLNDPATHPAGRSIVDICLPIRPL